MTGSPLTFISYRSLLRAGRYNRHIGLVLPGLAETHHTVYKSVKGMVLAHAYIAAGIVHCTSLVQVVCCVIHDRSSNYRHLFYEP